MSLWGAKGQLRLGRVYTTSSEPCQHVQIYADRCSGQNQNFNIVSLLAKCVQELPTLTIDLKFLQSGHSSNDCARMFSIIERHVPSTVELPQGYYDHAKACRRVPGPITVHEQKQFYRIGELARDNCNRAKCTDHQPLRFAQQRWYSFFQVDPWHGPGPQTTFGHSGVRGTYANVVALRHRPK